MPGTDCSEERVYSRHTPFIQYLNVEKQNTYYHILPEISINGHEKPEKNKKKQLKFNKGMTGASISQISKPIYKSVKLFIPYNDISAVYTTNNQIKKKKKHSH